MTKIEANNVENLEELSVVELKDLIKDNAKQNETDLPKGLWKMNKDQLIEEVKNAYAETNNSKKEEINTDEENIIELVEKTVEEKVDKALVEAVEKTVEEKVDKAIEELEEAKKPKENTNKEKSRRGKLIILTLPNGKEMEIRGSGKFHQYMRENYPEFKSWAMLSAVLRGEKNEKTEKFLESGMKARYAEGYKYGHKNQYTN